MSNGADSQTSSTLLRRLRQNPTDQAAWNDFVDRYGRMIYRWCRQWGLQEVDAEDATQNVLLDLARQMRTFVYDRNGSFRGWLKTIAYRSWCRLLEKRQRPGSATCDPETLNLLKSEAACEDFLAALARESDRELLDRAMQLVRLRVQPNTWEAFRLLVLEGCSGAEVGQRLNMKVGAVFVARGRVQKMLQAEMRLLQGDEAN
jgi:RNA polymerase sigma-70 factor (ECF subfamily)